MKIICSISLLVRTERKAIDISGTPYPIRTDDRPVMSGKLWTAKLRARVYFGRPGGGRTHDILIKSQTLYL